MYISDSKVMKKKVQNSVVKRIGRKYCSKEFSKTFITFQTLKDNLCLAFLIDFLKDCKTV